MTNFKSKVYQLVRKIPKGKVATYGQISGKLKSESGELRVNPKLVGWMLHANGDPDVPCHRVVDRNGRLAPRFAGPQLPGAKANGRRAFGGAEEQRRRLLSEGVHFKDEMHVDLSACLWQR